MNHTSWASHESFGKWNGNRQFPEKHKAKMFQPNIAIWDEIKNFQMVYPGPRLL